MTFLVRNEVENTFRCHLSHLESISDGPKSCLELCENVHKYAYFAIFCVLCEFLIFNGTSDQAENVDKVDFKARSKFK